MFNYIYAICNMKVEGGRACEECGESEARRVCEECGGSEAWKKLGLQEGKKNLCLQEPKGRHRPACCDNYTNVEIGVSSTLSSSGH